MDSEQRRRVKEIEDFIEKARREINAECGFDVLPYGVRVEFTGKCRDKGCCGGK